MTAALESLRAELATLLGSENVIDRGESLETYSKDFYWYSPVLKPLLQDKRADLIARPGTIAEARQVIATCFASGIPIVPRGAGTGNYGQCVPLYGGVVIDLARLDRIHSIADGVVHAEAGARLGTIETKARALGWELRCMPSTWMKSSIGGFFCGGSGGIGSVRWGGINANDTVKSVTVMTCEAEPRIIRLEERDSLKALHTYGTTGFMVEVEMRLAPKIDYDQLIFSTADWDKLLTWTHTTASNHAWRKRLVTQFQWPTPSFFKPLVKYFRTGEHVSFFLLDRAQTDAVVGAAAAVGIDCVFRQPLPDPPRPPFISDYTWNHTTLWALKFDPTITYLQAGFGPNFREQFAELEKRFPGEILFHLEWFGQPRGGPPPGELEPATVTVGGIPLVYFKSPERLREIIAACAEIGVFIANPHTYFLEEGGRHPNIADKRRFKTEVDPKGLLNPGKMKTYPNNPFDPAAAAVARAALKLDAN